MAEHSTIEWTDATWNPITGCSVGGESGPHARPTHPYCVQSLRDQCAAAGVPFFFKQWGEWVPVAKSGFAGYERKDVRTMLEPYATEMLRVGKRVAGRFLNGQEWSQMPHVT
jgi:protein gp37